MEEGLGGGWEGGAGRGERGETVVGLQSRKFKIKKRKKKMVAQFFLNHCNRIFISSSLYWFQKCFIRPQKHEFLLVSLYHLLETVLPILFTLQCYLSLVAAHAS